MPRLLRSSSRENRTASPGRMSDFGKRRNGDATDDEAKSPSYAGDGTLHPLQPLRSKIQHSEPEQRSISPILGALFRHVDAMSDSDLGTPVNSNTQRLKRQPNASNARANRNGANGRGATMSTGRIRPQPKTPQQTTTAPATAGGAVNSPHSSDRLNRVNTNTSQTSLRKLAILSSRANTVNDVNASAPSLARGVRSFGANKSASNSTVISDITTDSRPSNGGMRKSVDLKARRIADQQTRAYNEPYSPHSAPMEKPSHTHAKTVDSIAAYQRIRSANHIAGPANGAAQQQHVAKPASETRRRRGTPTISDINVSKKAPIAFDGGVDLDDWVTGAGTEGMSPRENVAAHLGRNRGTSLDSTIAASAGKTSPLAKRSPSKRDEHGRNGDAASSEKTMVEVLREEITQLRKDLTHVIGQRNEAQKKADRLAQIVQSYRENEAAERNDSIASSTTGSVKLGLRPNAIQPPSSPILPPASSVQHTPVADLVSQVSVLKATNSTLLDRIAALEKEKRSIWKSIARDEHNKSGRNLANVVRTSVEL